MTVSFCAFARVEMHMNRHDVPPEYFDGLIMFTQDPSMSTTHISNDWEIFVIPNHEPAIHVVGSGSMMAFFVNVGNNGNHLKTSSLVS
jgi:hypothetical protein